MSGLFGGGSSPQPLPPPPVPDTSAADKARELAATSERQARLSKGRASTLLTEGKGKGLEDDEMTAKKRLLGS